MKIIVRDGIPYIAFTPERVDEVKDAIGELGLSNGSATLQDMVDEAELQYSWELANYIDPVVHFTPRIKLNQDIPFERYLRPAE